MEKKQKEEEEDEDDEQSVKMRSELEQNYRCMLDVKVIIVIVDHRDQSPSRNSGKGDQPAEREAGSE